MLDEVEAAIYIVASTILRGEGFSYDVPSRAKGNQVEPWHNPTMALSEILHCSLKAVLTLEVGLWCLCMCLESVTSS